jgi:hypothetical protein
LERKGEMRRKGKEREREGVGLLEQGGSVNAGEKGKKGRKERRKEEGVRGKRGEESKGKLKEKKRKWDRVACVSVWVVGRR